MRYRLQRKEAVAKPNIIGNHSFPVHTSRWKDIAMSNNKEELIKIMPNNDTYRIEDTREEVERNERFDWQATGLSENTDIIE